METAAKATLICVFGVFVAANWSFGQCRANVSGKVVDETNLPVAGADVYLIEPRLARGNRYFGAFSTDSNGDFAASTPIDGPGSFFIYASKESAGYPSKRVVFYNEAEQPVVQLVCQAARTGIIVKLGPKAGYFQKISVLDADTGRPISDARITLRRLTSPIPRLSVSVFSISTSTALAPISGKYSGLAVPANVDVSYQISAPGYATSPETKMRLAPEEDAEISVKLQPAVNSGLK
jgi:hypothetical protein